MSPQTITIEVVSVDLDERMTPPTGVVLVRCSEDDARALARRFSTPCKVTFEAEEALPATLAKLAATEAELEAALRKIGKMPWEAYHGNACIALAGEALAKGVK